MKGRWNTPRKRYYTMRRNRLFNGKTIRCDFSPLSPDWCKERGYEGKELRWLGDTGWLLCYGHFIEVGGTPEEWTAREHYQKRDSL